MYGSEPRLGLASLGIPEAVLSALIADMDTSPNGRNEEELLQVLEGMGVEVTRSHTQVLTVTLQFSLLL